MQRFQSIGAALFFAFITPAPAEELSVPLSIGIEHVQRQVAAELGMGEGATAVLAHDDCNRIELDDLEVTTAESRLRASMAVTATAGTGVFGQCVGPGRWTGRMLVDLLPTASADGMAVRLTPESAELRRPDGSIGPLTRPARLLAEELVLPRLGQARVDLADQLAELDQLLAALQSAGNGEARSGEARLGEISVGPDGVVAGLVFNVAPIPAREHAPEAPLDDAEMAQWQRMEDELDGFLTSVIAAMAARAEDRNLRLELLGVLLDSRLAIARSLARDDEANGDPVRELFVDSWERLRPHAETLARTEAIPGAQGLRLAAFVAGADAIRALDALGPGHGIEISRDGLRRLARVLLANEAPATFTPLPLAIDDELRTLFFPERDAGPAPTGDDTAIRWWQWLVPAAHAADPSPAEALRGMLPRLPGLDDYLGVVSTLLEEATLAHLADDTRLPPEYHDMLDPLVRATAWKETCWRHYLDNANPPSVIRSAVGAVGMMQINARVWRGLYDMERLESDVAYNVNAGIRILEHYLLDYAVRRGEHEHPGGADNLVRATYAAYNGGPGQMPRYRRDATPARLQQIDQAFWRAYEQMKKERWPDVGSCYPV